MLKSLSLPIKCHVFLFCFPLSNGLSHRQDKYKNSIHFDVTRDYGVIQPTPPQSPPQSKRLKEHPISSHLKPQRNNTIEQTLHGTFAHCGCLLRHVSTLLQQQHVRKTQKTFTLSFQRKQKKPKITINNTED